MLWTMLGMGHYAGFMACLKKFATIKLSLKSPSLSHPILFAFTPYSLFKWYPQSKEIFIRSQYEMAETQHLMHKVRG
jgi:hypothetical protein